VTSHMPPRQPPATRSGPARQHRLRIAHRQGSEPGSDRVGPLSPPILGHERPSAPPTCRGRRKGNLGRARTRLGTRDPCASPVDHADGVARRPEGIAPPERSTSSRAAPHMTSADWVGAASDGCPLAWDQRSMGQPGAVRNHPLRAAQTQTRGPSFSLKRSTFSSPAASSFSLPSGASRL
jgi:hypothetical protein